MNKIKQQNEMILWLGFSVAMVLLVGTLLMFDLIGLK